MNVCNLGIDGQYYNVREYRQNKQTSPSPLLLGISTVNANLEFRFRDHADVWLPFRPSSARRPCLAISVHSSLTCANEAV